MKTDIIIGSKGKIGSAIFRCYRNNENRVIGYDKDFDKKIVKDCCDWVNTRCMHICIPCKDKGKFIDIVVGYALKILPEIIIIHSTVPVGTVRHIYNTLRVGFNHKKIIVVHSPCCGKHPDLYESIKSHFTKFFAVLPHSSKAYEIVTDIMHSLFDYTCIFSKPEETELAKILSTTEYAIHIAITTEFKRLCKEYNLDFNLVYHDWRENYNQGYQGVSDNQFTRPILEPCNGKIQGNCIVPNINLIKNYMKRTWLTDIRPKRLIK